MKITFFCDEDNLQWDSNSNMWTDTAYSHYDDNGVQHSVSYMLRNAVDPNSKPGQDKLGYSSLGNYTLPFIKCPLY